MPTVTAGAARWRRWTSAGYALQGLLGALVLTNLPGTSERAGIGEAEISMVVLTTVLCAGAGSVLAERIAIRFGSSWALAPGFAVQGVAVALVMVDLPFALLFPVFGLFGIGIGLADAGNAMQALTVQRAYGREIMSSFYAWQTLAAGLGALLVAGIGASPLPFTAAFAIGAVVALAVATPMRSRLAPDPEALTDSQAGAHAGASADATVTPDGVAAGARRVPLVGLAVFGAVVAAAFVADSVVGTWSSVFLDEEFAAAAVVVPLGFAAYQLLTLASRLAGDRLVRRWGRAHVLVAATVVGAAGMATAALAPTPAIAVLGFGVTGLGVGLLAPLSFAAAGDLAPARTDEIAARLNLFNYLGVVVGSGATGFIAEQVGLRAALLIPAAVLLPVLLTARSYRAGTQARERRSSLRSG